MSGDNGGNSMSTTLAFDVYGTLIDTHGVVKALKEMIGDQAVSFSHTWRDKQLEYSFRRGLMQNYVTFAECTGHALDYTCAFYQENLTRKQKDALLGIYKVLPAFEDARDGLRQLESVGYRLFAFSNGAVDALEQLLSSAGIRDRFIDLVSVDDVKSFKPNPAVYAHFLRQSRATVGDAWMISSNPFDVIGAVSAGMKAAWVKRSPEAVYDPWGIEPTLTVTRLTELKRKL
jgi:2-haloacid dehalogenase